jgi:hypothetical protein
MVYRKDWGQPQPGGQGFIRTAKVFGRKVNISAADLAAGGVVGMFQVPRYFLVLGAFGNVSKLDTGAVALKFDIGDPGLANRFLAASTAGQAGGTITTLAATGFNYPIYSETEIQFALNTAPGAAAAGILEYYLWGTIFA